MNADAPATDTTPAPQRPGIPGRYVVLGMFAMGILATATIFIYWDLHTRPFRPLTEAIGREIKNSLPKVEGGRSKGGPMTLRIAIRVPFEPDPATADTQQLVNRLVMLAREHADLTQFEILKIHLLQLAPERIAKEAEFEYPVGEVRDGVPFADATASRERE